MIDIRSDCVLSEEFDLVQELLFIVVAVVVLGQRRFHFNAFSCPSSYEYAVSLQHLLVVFNQQLTTYIYICIYILHSTQCDDFSYNFVLGAVRWFMRACTQVLLVLLLMDCTNSLIPICLTDLAIHSNFYFYTNSSISRERERAEKCARLRLGNCLAICCVLLCSL